MLANHIARCDTEIQKVVNVHRGFTLQGKIPAGMPAENSTYERSQNPTDKPQNPDKPYQGCCKFRCVYSSSLAVKSVSVLSLTV